MRVTRILAVLSITALMLGCDQDRPTSVSESLVPQLSAVAGESWIITTYYWDDGWVEHAWWDASFLDPDLRISFFAGNWSDYYPAFQADFDNVYAYGDIELPQGLVDDFEDGELSSVWQGGGWPCMNWGQGAEACEAGGVINVDISDGPASTGAARVAGLTTNGLVLHGEFDVRVDFSLSEGFHSLDAEAFVTLVVIDEREYSATMQVSTGTYESVERGGWQGYYKPIRITQTDDLAGKLRITRTKVSNGGRIVESVTGSGSRLAVEQEGDWRTFSFTALRHADGTVDGQWERIRRGDGNAADSKSHGVVTCFTIVGDEAWLGGYATSGLYGGRGVAWRVKDNGQGQSTDPDQISLQWTNMEPGNPAWYCARTPDDDGLELNDIKAGDIRIKR